MIIDKAMIENLRLRFIGVTFALCLAGVVVASAQEWQQFRGPGARGVSDNPKLPLTWDLEAKKNKMNITNSADFVII